MPDMRTFTIAFVAAVLAIPGSAAAQGGFGIGPRVTFVRGSEDADGSQRYIGGAIRLGGGHTALEVGMDYRSDVSGALTERVKDYPIHGSLLIFPVRARLAPYLLAGVAWYTQQVTQFSAPTGEVIVTDETTRKMGYHAGFGVEVRAHRHLGLHGDYRYTRIRFGDDDDEDRSSVIPGWIPGAERLKLSHEGSAFTWGATVYF
jgi:hypothetical protein